METPRRYKDVWMQWATVCLGCGVESMGERKDEEGNIAGNNSAL